MRKLYRNILMLACAGFMATSCSLDEHNPHAGDAVLTAYDSWKGLQAYCYTALNDELYTASDWMYVSEGGTDMWVAKGNGDSYKQLFYYEDMTASYNGTQKLWKQCYSMITSCNSVINEATNVEGGDAATIALLTAETKTLRALYYSILVSNYGPCTLELGSSSSVTGVVELYPKRSNEKDIYDQIIKDLTEAIPDLGVTPYGDNRARFTKKSAMGLLARVYAQRAGLGDSKFGDGPKYWQLAADAAEDLIDGASAVGAHLYNDIADVWADANNRTNKEALMIAAGPDGNEAAWQYSQKRNKLSAYSTGGAYSDFFNSNHKPGDKGYFYGRLNSQNWMPTKYTFYVFNPEWDRRWDYTFQQAWCEWSMVQCGWVTYDKGVKDVTLTMARKYGIAKDTMQYAGATEDEAKNIKLHKLYPYADCDGIPSAFAGNQYPAKIWPKGDTSGDKSKLLTVAPSAALAGTSGYTETTKAYAVPYPVSLDDNRFNTLYVHKPLTEEQKKETIFPVVCLSDLYGSNGLPYGNVSKGSEAGNPPAIGNGKTSSTSYPAMIKFNWSFNGCFVGSNLQIKSGDMFIMRMAEVYLIAAEAHQKLGDGGKAADYLNVLRKRAVRGDAPESEWKLTTATEEDVLDEFARELCGEFSRWALLKRHNAFETRLAEHNPRAAQTFKSFHYNRPIPYDFLSTILNMEEYGDNGYGSTANSGLNGLD